MNSRSYMRFRLVSKSVTLNDLERRNGPFWATVGKTVRPMLSDRCPSCPVCLWRWCTVVKRLELGWIKMKLGMQVGLGPGHTVLDRDPAPLPKRGTAAQLSAHVYCGQTVANRSYCWALVAQLTAVSTGMYGNVLAPNNCLFAWGIWAPSNTCSPGPTRLHNPNGVTMGSAVFAQITAECRYTLQRAAHYPLKLSIPMCDLDLHLTYDSLGPSKPTTQSASRSVQSFLHIWPQSVPILYHGTPLSPIKIAPSHGGLGPYLIHGSVGPPESTTQTASRSMQPFLLGSLVWQTDRQTRWSQYFAPLLGAK